MPPRGSTPGWQSLPAGAGSGLIGNIGAACRGSRGKAPGAAAALLLASALGAIGCAEVEDTGMRQVASAEDLGWLVERGEAMRAVIGDAIGNVTDARFLAGGEFVVVLDRYTPHLRLFRRDGTPLWQGGPAGEGPGELRFPRGIAVDDESVWVWEFGRVSRWRLEADSLAGSIVHSGGTTMPALAITLDCAGEILIYGMREVAATTFTGEREIGLVHRLGGMDEGAVHVRTLWRTERDGNVPHGSRRSGAWMSGSTAGWVVQHWKGYLASNREIIAFDCDGNVTGTFPEAALAEGDEPTVEALGSGAVLTTAGAALGVAKWRGGFLLMTVRQDGREREPRLILHAGGDDFRWVPVPPEVFAYLQHAEPEGGLLLARRNPVPHFIPLSPGEVEELFQLDPGAWSGSDPQAPPD